jgi:hypothetical protein
MSASNAHSGCGDKLEPLYAIGMLSLHGLESIEQQRKVCIPIDKPGDAAHTKNSMLYNITIATKKRIKIAHDDRVDVSIGQMSI